MEQQLSFSDDGLPDTNLLKQYREAVHILDSLVKKSLQQTRVFTDISFELEMKGAEARKAARRWQRNLEDSITQMRHIYTRKMTELETLTKERGVVDQQSTVGTSGVVLL